MSRLDDKMPKRWTMQVTEERIAEQGHVIAEIQDAQMGKCDAGHAGRWPGIEADCVIEVDALKKRHPGERIQKTHHICASQSNHQAREAR